MGRAWCTSKGFDQSAVVGPITQRSACGDLASAEISLTVNGQVRQQGSLDQMIWSSAEIIASLSEYFELQPGDLIFTGTPAGVSALQKGDVIEASVTGLVPISNTIV